MELYLGLAELVAAILVMFVGHGLSLAVKLTRIKPVRWDDSQVLIYSTTPFRSMRPEFFERLVWMRASVQTARHTRITKTSPQSDIGDVMKKLAVVLIAMGSLLGSCVAYEVPGPNQGFYQRDDDRGHNGDRNNYHDRAPNRADSDHDGVPNRQDNRPNDPNRY